MNGEQTIHIEPTIPSLNLVSLDNRLTKGKEEIENTLDQTNPTSTSVVVPYKNPLKSCLRGKSFNEETKPHVNKKLRFDLPCHEPQTNALASQDKVVLESSKNGSLFQVGMKINGNSEIPMYVGNCNSRGKVRENDREEHECCCIETETKCELTLNKQSVNPDGTSLTPAFNTNTDKADVSFKELTIEKDGGGKSLKGVVSKNGKNDYQELFSDDEDKDDEGEDGHTVIKCHDVGQQINRIQSFLNNERLRTNRKRKFPG